MHVARGLVLAALALPGLALRTWRPIRELEKLSDAELAAEAFADPDFPPYYLDVPVDHFPDDDRYAPHSNDSFALRYWLDARHYRPGGPVLVLAAGETSGANRLPFLRAGIAAQLAAATHGVAVVLEHRYYGTSVPTANLSTASLRFLRTEQALADTAYFARHVRLPGAALAHADLTPGTGAPWIVYGGSYAGAFAAFLRVRYPDVFWGAISSSGVTVAIHDYWQYYEAQRLFGPPECINTTQTLLHAIDQLLGATGATDASSVGQRAADHEDQHVLSPPSPAVAAASLAAPLQALFGLNLTHDDDFAALVSEGLAGWQDTNWDPAVSSPGFARYCANVTAPALLYPDLAPRRAAAEVLLAATSYGAAARGPLATALLNLVGWVRAAFPCAPGRSHDACFGNHDAAFYRRDDRAQHWRLWAYQYCTQWGYLATGSGVPTDRLPLVSRLLDLDYLSLVCREAFGITAPPDVDSVNRLGGFDIHAPRLAIVDGEADPWRAATPHALVGAHDRSSTTREPFLLIGGGAVHHWDENGLLPDDTTASLPPPPIVRVQAEEARFVQAWVEEWAAQRA